MLLNNRTVTDPVTPSKLRTALIPVRDSMRIGLVDQDNFAPMSDTDATSTVEYFTSIIDVPSNSKLFEGKILDTGGRRYFSTRDRYPRYAKSSIFSYLQLNASTVTENVYYWKIVNDGGYKFRLYDKTGTQVSTTAAIAGTGIEALTGTVAGYVHIDVVPVAENVSLYNVVSTEHLVSGTSYRTPMDLFYTFSDMAARCAGKQHIQRSVLFTFRLTKDDVKKSQKSLEGIVDIISESNRAQKSLKGFAARVSDPGEREVGFVLDTDIIVPRPYGADLVSYDVKGESSINLTDDDAATKVMYDMYISGEYEENITIKFNTIVVDDFQWGEDEYATFTGQIDVLFERMP